jgi:hypothetical protein
MRKRHEVPLTHLFPCAVLMSAPVSTPRVGLPHRKLLFTCISAMVGLVALWQTQHILQSDSVQAMVEACEKAPWKRATRHEFPKTHRDFEPLLGGGFACLVTQFLDGLVEEDPTGMITWVSCLCVCLPAIVAIGGGGTVRSGRAVAVPVRIAPGGAVRGNRSCGPLGTCIGAVVYVGREAPHGTVCQKRAVGARECAPCARSCGPPRSFRRAANRTRGRCRPGAWPDPPSRCFQWRAGP